VTLFVKVQRIFLKYFNITHLGKIPCRITIQLWVESFRMSASALQKKPPGSVCTVRLPHNIESVRQSFIRSPRRSAMRESVALRISDHSARRILPKALNFHQYKIVVVQELSDCDMANCSTVVESLIRILSNDVIILMTDAHFHLCVYVAIRQRKRQSSSINGLFAVHVWQFGVDWQTSES
jgi:hypothetical protein